MLFYGTTFAALFAAAWLITQLTLKAAVPVLYGQEGVGDYLGDYLRISTPLTSLWLVLIVWVFVRRSSS